MRHLTAVNGKIEESLRGKDIGKVAPATEPVTVIFRRWKGKRDGQGIIALFPEVDHDRNGAMCSSFEHIGQHGGASYAGVIARTAPAEPSEYAALKRELESEPYRYTLRIRRRRP